jgi:hypothetical protein
MDTFAQSFEDMIVLENPKITQNDTAAARTWLSRLRGVAPSYEPSVRFDSNKTLVFGCYTNQPHIVPLDVYLTTATVVVSPSFTGFIDEALPTIVRYLISTIKTMVSPECANELRFRMILYIPINHTSVSKLRYSPYFVTNSDSRPLKTIFGESLPSAMARFDLEFAFNEDWTLCTQKKVFQDFNANNSGLKLF